MNVYFPTSRTNPGLLQRVDRRDLISSHSLPRKCLLHTYLIQAIFVTTKPFEVVFPCANWAFMLSCNAIIRLIILLLNSTLFSTHQPFSCHYVKSFCKFNKHGVHWHILFCVSLGSVNDWNPVQSASSASRSTLNVC